jgi:DNA-binding transcriptional MerR regulator
LRYYEQIGVIPAVGRDPGNGYRAFTQDDLHLLDVVACLAGAGMPISDMREYVANARGGSPDPGAQLRLMESQQERLALEAKALDARRRYVDLKVAYWRAVQAGDNEEAERIVAEARVASGLFRRVADESAR